MCSPYRMISSSNPGGKKLEEPKKPGSAPPPDMVNNQEVAPQSNRQRLADEAQAAYEAQPQPINWRERNPSKDDPSNIRLARLQSGGPLKGKPGSYESADHDRYQLKLNPDGTPALGMGKEYYDNLDNWYSKSEWDSFFNDSPASDDGVNL